MGARVYKKINAIAMVLLCALCMAGCSDVAYQTVDISQTSETAAVAIAPLLDGSMKENSPLESASILLEVLDYFHMPMENSAMLDVKNIPQLPELPNGCEITSATTVLNYLGFDVDKNTMAGEYLPSKTPYWIADPNEAFMGDPHSENAFYCLPGPVVQAVNAYLADAGATDVVATELTGATMQDLKWYLTKGSPVLVWATRAFAEPEYGQIFSLPDGSAPFVNLHCMVLTGFDGELLFFADPMQEVTEADEEAFSQSYQEVGMHAVVIARE